LCYARATFCVPSHPRRSALAAARPHVALTGFLLYDNATGGALEVPYGCDEHLGLLQLIDRTLIEATVPAVASALSILASPPPLGAADHAASPLSPASSEIAAALRLAVQSFLSRGFPTSDVDLSVGDEEYEEHKQVRGRGTRGGDATHRSGRELQQGCGARRIVVAGLSAHLPLRLPRSQVLEVERERREAQLAAERAAAEAAAAAAAATAPREYPYYKWGRWLVGMSANFKLAINDVLDDNLPSYEYLYHNGTVRRWRMDEGGRTSAMKALGGGGIKGSMRSIVPLPAFALAGTQARSLLHVLAPALASRGWRQGHVLRRRGPRGLRRAQPHSHRYRR